MIAAVTVAFQNAATAGEGLTQFLELLYSGTYYDFIDLNVAGLFDRVRNRTRDGIGRDGRGGFAEWGGGCAAPHQRRDRRQHAPLRSPAAQGSSRREDAALTATHSRPV